MINIAQYLKTITIQCQFIIVLIKFIKSVLLLTEMKLFVFILLVTELLVSMLILVKLIDSD